MRGNSSSESISLSLAKGSVDFWSSFVAPGLEAVDEEAVAVAVAEAEAEAVLDVLLKDTRGGSGSPRRVAVSLLLVRVVMLL